MAPFEQHPLHVRRRIAMVITIVVALVLVSVMVLVYTHPKVESGSDTARSMLGNFYNTISDQAQSVLGTK